MHDEVQAKEDQLLRIEVDMLRLGVRPPLARTAPLKTGNWDEDRKNRKRWLAQRCDQLIAVLQGAL